ncbi:MAG: thymidine phosphorylase [Christensenellales bacterium]|jgi:pyrimidine-nucleoside phosphorylase
MNMVRIIEKKRDALALNQEEIEFFIRGICDGTVPDYQAAALLMAVTIRGMDREETVTLTKVMAASGDMLDLSQLPGVTADKHSTGGVGDTTSLITGPVVAACGVIMAKMSGAGLGHTGGTLDKLSAISGMRVDLSAEAFIEAARETGFCDTGQTGDLAPADGILYALRDVTGTTDSMPLIASSIMSKKLAAGAQVIVLDVKCGTGAFMKTPEEAFELARWMVDIGKGAGRIVSALVTDMNAPLGNAVGNGLEVKEAIEVLSGRHEDSPLRRVSLALAAEILVKAGMAGDKDAALSMAEESLASGSALSRFRAMIKKQSGDETVCNEPQKLIADVLPVPIAAPDAGCIHGIEPRALGQSAVMMGAGRMKKTDIIDPQVGIVLLKRPGESVEKGESWAMAYTRTGTLPAGIESSIQSALTVAESVPPKRELIYGTVE